MTSKQYDIVLIGGPFDGRQTSVTGTQGSIDVLEKLNVTALPKTKDGGSPRVRYNHSDDCNRHITDGSRHEYHFEENAVLTDDYSDGVDIDLSCVA